MDREEFKGWSDRYGSLFGMAQEADFQMFDSWFEVFCSCGYSVAELDAARLEIAQNPPRFRNEHLAAIHAAVRGRRKEELRRRFAGQPPDPSEVGECAECGDSGMVVVPHPAYVTAGEWMGHGSFGYRPTAAVACRCYRGRRVLEHYDSMPPSQQDRVGRPMGLDAYQRVAPGWKSLMAKRDRETFAALVAHDASHKADRAGGPLAGLVKRIRERVAAQGANGTGGAPRHLAVYTPPGAAGGDGGAA